MERCRKLWKTLFSLVGQLLHCSRAAQTLDHFTNSLSLLPACLALLRVDSRESVASHRADWAISLFDIVRARQRHIAITTGRSRFSSTLLISCHHLHCNLRLHHRESKHYSQGISAARHCLIHPCHICSAVSLHTCFFPDILRPKTSFRHHFLPGLDTASKSGSTECAFARVPPRCLCCISPSFRATVRRITPASIDRPATRASTNSQVSGTPCPTRMTVQVLGENQAHR